MAQSRPWINEIIDVLKELGGHGYYKDIYDKVEERNIMDFESNPNWKSAIRQNIEFNSSNSIALKGITDLFYSVDGKGKGHWEIIDFEVFIIITLITFSTVSKFTRRTKKFFFFLV